MPKIQSVPLLLVGDESAGLVSGRGFGPGTYRLYPHAGEHVGDKEHGDGMRRCEGPLLQIEVPVDRSVGRHLAVFVVPARRVLDWRRTGLCSSWLRAAREPYLVVV